MVYQEDFLIPGNSPRLASSLKQIRHILKSRKYPRFLPQRKQRFTILEENLGFFAARATTDFFAILVVHFSLSLMESQAIYTN
jgi:hypothetical protein